MPTRRASAARQRLNVRVTLTIITSGRTAPNRTPLSPGVAPPSGPYPIHPGGFPWQIAR